jgi:hypothetical protein
MSRLIQEADVADFVHGAGDALNKIGEVALKAHHALTDHIATKYPKTFDDWKAAVEKSYRHIWIDGDEHSAEAFLGKSPDKTSKVGTWDGHAGEVFDKPEKAEVKPDAASGQAETPLMFVVNHVVLGTLDQAEEELKSVDIEKISQYQNAAKRVKQRLIELPKLFAAELAAGSFLQDDDKKNINELVGNQDEAELTNVEEHMLKPNQFDEIEVWTHVLTTDHPEQAGEALYHMLTVVSRAHEAKNQQMTGTANKDGVTLAFGTKLVQVISAERQIMDKRLTSLQALLDHPPAVQPDN